jgi:hypothetical protein
MKKLFNPFEFYSEKALIAFGIIVLSIASLAAWYFGGRYDGVIDFHLADDIAIWQPFADNAIATFSLALPLFILGRSINNRTRLVDIIAASLVARTPFVLEPFFNMGGYLGRATDAVTSQYMKGGSSVLPETEDLIIILAFSLISILLLVWFAILLYNGFKTATNIRKTAHIVWFIAAVIIAEIISAIIFYFI